MLKRTHVWSLCFGCLVAMSMWSCGAKKKVEEGETAAAINFPDLISKMTWKASVFNNSSNKIFSGFDGTNVFRVFLGIDVFGELPETVELDEEQREKLFTSPEYEAKYKVEIAKVSLEADPALVSNKIIDEEGFRSYELTTLKAGTATIKVKFGTTETALPIQVAAYTAAQVAAGKARYNAAVAGATPSPACASCHRAATGVDHSPYFLAQYTDGAILSTIKTGVNTDDKYETQSPHKMTFTNAADEAGIVAYLRSLDPKLLPVEQPE